MSNRYERIVDAIKEFDYSAWNMSEVEDIINDGYTEWIHRLAAEIEEKIYS